ncbi:heparinase, partial [bacterium]|nr:heparinase [bacterium]
INKGVVLPFETRHDGWVRSHNNWGQVCHGGLTAGALAVMEDKPGLAAKTVHNALHNVTNAMSAFAPKGSYPEGPGYWSYGTTYNVLLIDALESTLGTDFGLSKAPGFSQTGEYLSLVTGPSGRTFNYADGGAGRGPEPARWWFAARYDRPDWILRERDIFADAMKRYSNNRVTGGRFLSMSLFWMEDMPRDVEIEMPLNWYSKGDVPITLHRSSWTDPNAVFLGLKAGSPSSNHGQMDTGSFVLDADGVRWAKDLGAEGYHGIESRGMNLWDRSQDSDRWTIFRQQNHGHNTLVINDKLQVAKNRGAITRFSDEKDSPFSIVDLSAVYEGQAKSVKRGVMLLPSNEVVIRDEISGLKPNGTVRWGMITPAEVGRRKGKTIVLKQKGETLRLVNRTTGDSVDWSIINTEKPRNEWDSPNRGTRMVALKATVPASGKLVLNVLLTPGSCEDSVMDSWQPRALKKW